MNSISATVARCSALLSVGLAVFNTHAQLVVPARGYATLDLILITDDTVIASTTVSGRAEDELFALDTRDRTIKWRQKDTNSWSGGVADGSKAFFVFFGDFLQKRELGTGVILWQKNLSSISQQKTPAKFNFGKVVQEWMDKIQSVPASVSFRPWGAGLTPNYYRYEALVSGSKLVVFRRAIQANGCNLVTCFNDWLILDPRTGKNLKSGSGEVVAQTANTALIKDDSRFFLIESGQLTELVRAELQDANVQPWSTGFNPRQYSSKDRLLLKGSATGQEDLLIFNGSNQQLSAFKLPANADYQMNYVLCDRYLIRYADCPRYSASGKRHKGSPWFELYDLSGRLIRKATLEDTPENWFVKFVGFSPNGKALFEAHEEAFSLDIPTLSVSRYRPPVSFPSFLRERTYTSHRIGAGSECLYETESSPVIDMLSDELPHELRINVLDSDSGKLLWRYIEPVTIKPMKRGSN